ncbi:3798_t:CDS:2, partial [Acaulospora colombiana]
MTREMISSDFAPEPDGNSIDKKELAEDDLSSRIKAGFEKDSVITTKKLIDYDESEDEIEWNISHYNDSTIYHENGSETSTAKKNKFDSEKFYPFEASGQIQDKKNKSKFESQEEIRLNEFNSNGFGHDSESNDINKDDFFFATQIQTVPTMKKPEDVGKIFSNACIQASLLDNGRRRYAETSTEAIVTGQ